MTGYLRLLIPLSVMALLSGRGNAQTEASPAPVDQVLSDTTAEQQARMATIEFYHHFMGQDSRLLNGTEHGAYLPMNGNPCFEVPGLQTGTIIYEGALYPHVQMLYDIVRDELVVPSPDGELLALSIQKVSDFYLLGHHFIATPNGYYDQLCTGKVTLLAKRVKRVLETIEGLDVVRRIEYHEYFFIEKDGVRHSVANLHTLVGLLKDKKKEINQDLKAKKIRYKNNHEQSLIEAVNFYNQSIHS